MPIPEGEDLAAIRASFERDYKRRYGHRQDLTRIEIAEIKVGATRRAARKEDADGS